MGNTARKPWLTLCADFGGAFAWGESESGDRLFDCCGSDDYYWSGADEDAAHPQSFREEYGISAELMRDIIRWQRIYEWNVPPDEGSRRDELQPLFEKIDEEGFALARRLKDEIGNRFRIGYGAWSRKHGGAWNIIKM